MTRIIDRMIYGAVVLVIASCFLPAQGKYSSLDSVLDEQLNSRIAPVEARTAELEAKTSTLENSVAGLRQEMAVQSQQLEAQGDQLSRIEQQLKALSGGEVAAAAAPYSPKTADIVTPEPVLPEPAIPSPAVSAYYSTGELQGMVAAYRATRRYMEADVAPRSAVWRHLKDSNHNFTNAQVSGLSQNEALWLHSAAHAGRILPKRGAGTMAMASVAGSPVVVKSRTVTKSAVLNLGNTGYSAGCANGQCARPAASYGVFSKAKARRLARKAYK